mgnify:CR=1 FL=1
MAEQRVAWPFARRLADNIVESCGPHASEGLGKCQIRLKVRASGDVLPGMRGPGREERWPAGFTSTTWLGVPLLPPEQRTDEAARSVLK